MSNGYPLFTYTRAEAIEDGVLIDISSFAHEIGYSFDVAVTFELFQIYLGDVSLSESDDIYNMLEILKMTSHFLRTSELKFVTVLSCGSGKPRIVPLKAVYSPEDAGKKVLTIMMPYED